MRLAMLLVAVLISSPGAPGSAAEDGTLARVRELRLQGALEEALALAKRALEDGGSTPAAEIDLHLELSRIHDRLGLHHNTRPVAAALEEIEAAASSAASSSPLATAKIELARAEYYYRAEMQGREFPRATAHAERAIASFRTIGDRHGEAEAVHKHGLIFLQRRELDRARELFDRSLELDRAAGERPMLRADYERHVGFILLLEDDLAASIPYFERSLAIRREAGAIDASLFAARALGSALVDAGRVEEARPHLLYAMIVAERLGSPVGKARTGLVLGRLYERSGDPPAARIAFEMTLALAESIEYSSVVQQAQEALEQLGMAPAP